jgi:large subunit ribosomal protein L2
MGKNLRQQRRGRGSPGYRTPSHRFIGKISYENLPEGAAGKIINIIDAAGKFSPVAIVDINGRRHLHIASEGASVGQQVRFGGTHPGDVTKLENIPEGTKICNVELRPGDGGKVCRASGSFATLITRDHNKCVVLLPSKKKKIFNAGCRATIGVVAGGGRKEKPFMKAGTKYHAMRTLGRLYPRTSGVSMNAVNHPFGGQTKPGKHKTVSRHAPPGKKVGSISPKRTGVRKR